MNRSNLILAPSLALSSLYKSAFYPILPTLKNLTNTLKSLYFIIVISYNIDVVQHFTIFEPDLRDYPNLRHTVRSYLSHPFRPAGARASEGKLQGEQSPQGVGSKKEFHSKALQRTEFQF